MRAKRRAPKPQSSSAKQRSMVVAAMIALGCAREEAPDDLQALLDDGALVELSLHNLSSSPGKGGGEATPDAGSGGPGGAGGSVGMGGAGGAIGTGGRAGPSDGGIPFDGGIPTPFVFPTGFWQFDDCNEFRADLFDSSFNNHTAFRSVRAQCAPSVQGQGVTFPNPKDIAYVPDQPSFAFEQGMTIAAWVNPAALGGTQTLVRKREGGTSSFALVVNAKKYQFVIARAGRAPATVSAPVKGKRWTHVAATYDGTDLRLYVDGEEASRTRAPGVIDGGEGPLLIGNDGNQRRLDGVIDNVWFATRPAPAGTIMGLTCLRQPPTLAATPAKSDPVPPETPVTFDIAITNNNSTTCEPDSFVLFANLLPEGIRMDPSFTFVPPVASGETAHVPMTVTSGDVDDGEYVVGFGVADQSRGEPAFGEVTYVVAATGCRVSSRRELMIRHLSIVDDPIRTTFLNAPAEDPRRGAWTFGRLMEELAPSPAEAPDMVEEILNTWLAAQTINGQRIQPRPFLRPLVLDAWPRTMDGKLDLTRAPMQLLAIVNRFDLRDVSRGTAGEGRFVFAVLGPGGFPMEFTMIFEYDLPAANEAEILRWAQDWHALSALPFPSEEYNAALQALTDRFALRGVLPARPNGSALNAFRTNEIALEAPWQLREFTLDPATGRLRPDTIKLTPDLAFDGTPTLAEYINANEAAIVAEKHTVPLEFAGVPFLTGAVFNNLNAWFAPGVVNPEARHKFSLNTCNGCHSAQETNTFFLQIGPRFGGEAPLSPFLTGTTVFDPMTGTPRILNDLDRRRRDLHRLVCPDNPLPPPPQPMLPPAPPPRPPRDAGMGGSSGPSEPLPRPMIPATEPVTSLGKGIDRVH